MSAEVVNITPEVAREYGMINCPHCGFLIPDDLVICWKCGENKKE